MRNNFRKKTRFGSAVATSVEAGYTLLMVVFMVATLLLFAVAATPSVVTEGRRIKEQEDIWRGNQYVRAIRLYYQKTGRYPQTIDDLTKADAAGNHFLRKQYADLMNSEDGKWRMIYVSASGQLMGSVRYHSLQEMALAQNGLAASFGTVAGGAGATQVAPGQAGQTGPQGQPQTPAFGSSTQPQSLAPLEPVDGPVLGGFLIGVGGKQKRPSLMVYQGGKTYYEWEFIWNPLATGAVGGAPVALPGATAPGGTAPAGAVPGATAPGATTPGATAPGASAPDGTTPGVSAPDGTGTTAPAGSTPPVTLPPGTPPAATNPPADPNAPASAPTP